MGSCHPMRYGSHENVWSQFVPDDETMENRYKNKEAKKYSAKDIMTMICKAYNDVFHENYADKKTALTYNMADITDMEYVEIGDELTILANQMDEYLSGRVSENGTYKSVETGQTFQTVKRMVQNLLEYDISKYNKTIEKEKKGSKYSKWYPIIMIVATIIFLLTGFIWKLWEYNWIAFAVGGLLCGIVGILDEYSDKNK